MNKQIRHLVKTWRYAVLFCLFYTSSHSLWAQGDIAVAPGAWGNYVYCGNTIPKDFSYVIERSPTDRDQWQIIGKTAFVADSTLFFNTLLQATVLNPAYTLPDRDSWSLIWQTVQKASIVDSVYYHGAFPAFRQALGMVFYDTSVRPGETYSYRVGRTDGGSAVLASALPKQNLSALRTVYAEPSERSIRIRYYGGMDPAPTRVRLYRETYLQTDFKALDIPSFYFEEDGRPYFLLGDSLAKPGIVYRYYAVPYDLWGNAGDPSDTIRVAHAVEDDVPQILGLQAEGDTARRAIRIKWQTSDPKRVETVSVYRSQFYESVDYVHIGTAGRSDTVFYDHDVAPARVYYYSIVLHGGKGNGSPSLRVPGLLPASANGSVLSPSTLEATYDGNGQVLLQWNRPDNNVKGYYVYRSTEGDSGLILCSGLVRSIDSRVSYTDTLIGDLNGEIRYAVRTLDLSDNLSPLSETVKVYKEINSLNHSALTRPQVVWNGQVALLHWSASSTTGVSPYSGFVVYRQEVQDAKASDFVAVSKELPASQNYWEDNTYVPGVRYRYKVVGMTGNGENKESEPTMHYVALPKLYAPAGLMARVDGSHVVLSWDASVQDDVVAYQVLRHNGVDNSAPEVLQKLDRTAGSFVDKNARKGSYYYTVISIGKNGKSSDVENWVRVELD